MKPCPVPSALFGPWCCRPAALLATILSRNRPPTKAIAHLALCTRPSPAPNPSHGGKPGHPLGGCPHWHLCGGELPTCAIWLTPEGEDRTPSGLAVYEVAGESMSKV
jgi:hypothetical protein